MSFIGAGHRSIAASSRHTVFRFPKYLCELVPDSPGVRRFSAIYIDNQDPKKFRREAEGVLLPIELRSLGDLRQHLSARSAADFEQGRTVELDGWILSRTEADSLTLATLYRMG